MNERDKDFTKAIDEIVDGIEHVFKGRNRKKKKSKTGHYR